MVGNASFHRWRDSKRLVDTAEIVVHKIQRDIVFEIFQFFRVAIGQPREPAHGHPHRQILPFANARRNVRVVRCSDDCSSPCPHANCRTVSDFAVRLLIAVNLHQHRIIHVRAKRILNCVQIRLVSIRGQLHAGCKACLQIVNEVIRRASVARANEPARHKFRIRINGRPCPNVAVALGLVFRRGVLFLAAHKRPDFVALNPFARQIFQRLVLVIRAKLARINQQLHNAVNRNINQSGRGANAATVNQTAKNLDPFFGVQFVHGDSMLARAGIVNNI